MRTFEISPPKKAVSDLLVTPRSAGPGDTFIVRADVTNDGGVAGNISVDLRVDASSDVRQVRLVPGDTVTVVRFVNVPAQPPAAGITSPGIHTVNIDGLAASYEIRPPDIQAAVATETSVNVDTTTVADAQGNPVDIDPDGQVAFGAGSITLSIPVVGKRGQKVASFVDTTSGISILGKSVNVPVKDPDTGETLLTLRGELKNVLEIPESGVPASATFDFLNLLTEERRGDLSADDPNVGKLGVSLRAGLAGC